MQSIGQLVDSKTVHVCFLFFKKYTYMHPHLNDDNAM